MDILRSFANGKVAEWQILIVTCKLTPRLQERIESTIRIYQETANQQDPDVIESGKHLMALAEAIEHHWTQIFADVNKTALIFRYMWSFRIFLRAKLLEDYVGRHHKVNINILSLGRSQGELKDRQRAARELHTQLDHIDDIYQQRVVIVLDELMLDRAHVESKLRAAVARDGKPGSDIQPLIDRCDWTNLATLLCKDQFLTTQLFSKEENSEKEIQQAIRRMQKKYFLKIISPLEFVPSELAQKMSEKFAKSKTASKQFPNIYQHPYRDQEDGDSCYSPLLEDGSVGTGEIQE